MSKENEAKKLIEEIKAMGFTQIQIAEEILVSPVTVSRWKSGEIEIPDGKLLALRGIILRAADAKVIKAAEDLGECFQYADRRIAWEVHGLGNGFAERVEASLTAFRQAQQARALIEEKNDDE